MCLCVCVCVCVCVGCRAAEEEEEMEGEEDLPGTVDVDHGASREALRTDDEVVER